MAATAKERVLKQRAIRQAAGWVEVRVWIPTKQDATVLQTLVQDMRAKVPNPADYASREYNSWASK